MHALDLALRGPHNWPGYAHVDLTGTTVNASRSFCDRLCSALTVASSSSIAYHATRGDVAS